VALPPEAIVRLNLGHIWLSEYPLEIPVHGFLIKHPGGAGLVDTGYGTPLELIKDYRPVNASVAAALRTHDVDPSDIHWVINSHLHFDHCGQNAVFPQAPFYGYLSIAASAALGARASLEHRRPLPKALSPNSSSGPYCLHNTIQWRQF